MVNTATKPGYTFVADTKRDEGSFVQIKSKLQFLPGSIFLYESAVDPNDLQCTLFQIVRFLGVQREDLPGHLSICNNECRNRLRSQAAHRFEPMAAIGSPEAIARCRNRNNGVEETSGLVDNICQALVMRIR